MAYRFSRGLFVAEFVCLGLSDKHLKRAVAVCNENLPAAPAALPPHTFELGPAAPETGAMGLGLWPSGWGGGSGAKRPEARLFQAARSASIRPISRRAKAACLPCFC